jgi:hypothetical protein
VGGDAPLKQLLRAIVHFFDECSAHEGYLFLLAVFEWSRPSGSTEAVARITAGPGYRVIPSAEVEAMSFVCGAV